MNTPRVLPNLLDEARHLTDTDYGYGALILARVIGQAMRLDNITPSPALELAHMPTLARARAATRSYGDIVNQAWPQNPARRHVILIDAADLAFA